MQGLQPKDVLLGVLHNAQFWEMGNVRGEIVLQALSSVLPLHLRDWTLTT